MTIKEEEKLVFHLQEIRKGRRRFETAAQAVYRMILEKGYEKVIKGGKIVYDFKFFRQGKKHVVGWYNELNEFVHFIKDAAQGGLASELAFVFVGEPGNGKTFTLDYLCKQYRNFCQREENKKYTFQFVGLDKIGYDRKLAEIQSLTFEDPVILAMNLFDNDEDNKRFLLKYIQQEEEAEKYWSLRRPLGASSQYILNQLMEVYNGNIEEILNNHIKIIPVEIKENLGILTGKYSAKDKISSSSVDLVGEESLQHLLLLGIDDPNKFNLRRGAIARVAGGGIHFIDEIFKIKRDLLYIYLQVIQNRQIEIDGWIWPVDCLIIATSNNWEYNRFISEKEESPITSRCRICYIPHNTDYLLQKKLVAYVIGEQNQSISGEKLHIDPNLINILSVIITLTRLPHDEKLSPIDMMKLEAGEISGDKSINILLEIKEKMNANADVTKRFGHKGLDHRHLGKIIQTINSFYETNESRCIFSGDIFRAVERVILDYVDTEKDREKYFQDLKIAENYYYNIIKVDLFNAYRNDEKGVENSVRAYVNMIIGITKEVGPDKIFVYTDPQTKEKKPIKIDEKYIEAVEERMGLRTKEEKEAFRREIRSIYGTKIVVDPNYNFMDQERLVQAITSLVIDSDVNMAGNLVGALANRTDEENLQLYNRILEIMLKKLGYCESCAKRTLEKFIELYKSPSAQ